LRYHAGVSGDSSPKPNQPDGEVTMRISPGDYAYLERKINETLAKYPNLVDEYERGKFARSYKVKDLQRRFCFDLTYGAGLSQFIVGTLYTYLNDDHVYTALKRICPTVERKY